MCGQAVVERNQVAEAVAGFELVELHELVGHGDAVDVLAALLQLAHAAEDAAMLLQAEVVGLQRAGGLDVQSVVEQDGAEHEPLGVYISGKALVGGIGDGHDECTRVPAIVRFRRFVFSPYFEQLRLWKKCFQLSPRERPGNHLE